VNRLSPLVLHSSQHSLKPYLSALLCRLTMTSFVFLASCLVVDFLEVYQSRPNHSQLPGSGVQSKRLFWFSQQPTTDCRLKPTTSTPHNSNQPNTLILNHNHSGEIHRETANQNNLERRKEKEKEGGRGGRRVWYGIVRV